MELEDIIEGKTAEPVEPVVEEAVVVEEVAAEEVKAEETPEAKEDPAPVKEQVPLATYLEERTERKALETRISSMEADMRKQPEVKAPDMFADPEGYQKHLAGQMQKVEANTRMDMSQAIAEEKHGTEAVAVAFEALKASGDQSAINAILTARLPYQSLMAWEKQRVAMQEIGDDPTAWRDAEREKMRAEIQDEMTAKQAKIAGATPAPSMAGVTGIGGGPKAIWSGPTPLEKAVGD